MRTAFLISSFALVLYSAGLPTLRAQTPGGSDAAVEHAAERLVANLGGGNLAERWHAAYRLGQLGESAAPATEALVKALRDDDFRVVWYSIYALGEIGPRANGAVPALREALAAEKDASDPQYVANKALGDKYTRRFAAEALGRIGPAAAAATPDLRRAATSDDASLRVAAALALWKVDKTSAAQSVDELSKMLASTDVNAAHEAALAFTRLGAAGRPGIQALVSALNSDTDDVRRSAARALGQLGPVAILELTAAVASTNVGVRRAAAQGFDWLGKVMRDKILRNPKVPLASVQEYYGHLNSSAVAALRVALADKDADVRRLAAEAIGSIGPVAIPTLVAALEEQDEHLRSAAALAMEHVEARSPLGEIVPAFADSFRKDSVSALTAGIASENPFVRLHAVRMFATLGVARVAPSARPQLVSLLKDDNVQVRRHASTALRQLRDARSTQPVTNPE